MGLQQDVVLRQIRDMERLLAQLLLRKDFSEIEETAESLDKRDGRIPESGNTFLDTLVRMADQGDVCAAEDLLLENIPAGDESYLELALIFYLHVSEMEDELLENSNYSKEEIPDGLEMLAEAYGVSGIRM